MNKEETKEQLYLELLAAWGSSPLDEEAVREILNHIQEEAYKKGLLEEQSRRWKLNERLCKHFGIDPERELDSDIVDEVIEKHDEARWCKCGI